MPDAAKEGETGHAGAAAGGGRMAVPAPVPKRAEARDAPPEPTGLAGLDEASVVDMAADESSPSRLSTPLLTLWLRGRSVAVPGWAPADATGLVGHPGNGGARVDADESGAPSREVPDADEASPGSWPQLEVRGPAPPGSRPEPAKDGSEEGAC